MTMTTELACVAIGVNSNDDAGIVRLFRRGPIARATFPDAVFSESSIVDVQRSVAPRSGVVQFGRPGARSIVRFGRPDRDTTTERMAEGRGFALRAGKSIDTANTTGAVIGFGWEFVRAEAAWRAA